MFGECPVPTWQSSRCVEAEDVTTVNMNCCDNGKGKVKDCLSEQDGGVERVRKGKMHLIVFTRFIHSTAGSIHTVIFTLTQII